MSAAKDKPDTAAVVAAMEAYASAITSADVDALSEVYSGAWQGSKDITKAQLMDHYKRSSGLWVYLDSGEIRFEGDIATFSPVSISSPKGTVTYTHTLKKESDGVWRICHSETIDWEIIEIDDFEMQVARAPRGSGGILTLPFSNGERTLDLPRGKGCLVGIDTQNATPENIMRSAMQALGLLSGEPVETFVHDHLVEKPELGCEPDINVVSFYEDAFQSYQSAVDTISPLYQ